MCNLDFFAQYLLAVFAVAWLLPLVLITTYYLVRVPARLEEIKQSFLRKDPSKPEGLLPAAHYVRLFVVPKCELSTPPKYDELKKCITAQFDFYHRRSWYLLAGFFLAIVSGLSLFAVWALLAKFKGFESFISSRTAFALLGAYVWSLYEIQSRRNAGDLTPIELFWIDLRYLAAIPLGYCVGLLGPEKLELFMAFGISALPFNDIRRIFRKRTLRQAGIDAAGRDIPTENLLVTVVRGIDLDALTRLEELQITTYTSLAYADPIKLMAKTGYSLRLIVQWMDHALLAIYAPTHKLKLVSAGLPCSLDVKEFFVAHFAKERNDDNGKTFDPRKYDHCPTVRHLADAVGMKAELLNEVFQRVWSDPHVVFLDTLWYTGYPDKEMRTLGPCPHHDAKG